MHIQDLSRRLDLAHEELVRLHGVVLQEPDYQNFLVLQGCGTGGSGLSV